MQKDMRKSLQAPQIEGVATSEYRVAKKKLASLTKPIPYINVQQKTYLEEHFLKFLDRRH